MAVLIIIQKKNGQKASTKSEALRLWKKFQREFNCKEWIKRTISDGLIAKPK
jgi:hypothetical protein